MKQIKKRLKDVDTLLTLSTSITLLMSTLVLGVLTAFVFTVEYKAIAIILSLIVRLLIRILGSIKLVINLKEWREIKIIIIKQQCGDNLSKIKEFLKLTVFFTHNKPYVNITMMKRMKNDTNRNK